MSDETEVTLIPDTIKGVREFDVDQYGRLSAPAMGNRWKPGWNEAIHAGYPVSDHHKIAQLGCACGFYGYFSDNHTSHRTKHTVTAVVEGRGRATVSDRGFRVAEARIIALAPSDAGRFPWFFWLLAAVFPPYSLITAPALIANAVYWERQSDETWQFGVSFCIALVATFLSVICTASVIFEGDNFWQWNPKVGGDGDQKALLKRNYPDAQVFGSRRRMLRTVKLSESPVSPMVFGPESEGFWE